jgi:hypothetical protein
MLRKIGCLGLRGRETGRNCVMSFMIAFLTSCRVIKWRRMRCAGKQQHVDRK